MADAPTVVVVGGGSDSSSPPAPEPQVGQPEAQSHGEAIQLGAVLESNRQIADRQAAVDARIDALDARDSERGAQLDRLIASIEAAQAAEPEPDVEEIEPEPEPVETEPEPEPEITRQECKGWLKPFLGAR